MAKRSTFTTIHFLRSLAEPLYKADGEDIATFCKVVQAINKACQSCKNVHDGKITSRDWTSIVGIAKVALHDAVVIASRANNYKTALVAIRREQVDLAKSGKTAWDMVDPAKVIRSIDKTVSILNDWHKANPFAVETATVETATVETATV